MRKAVADLERRNAQLAEDNVRLTDAVAARDAFLTIAAHELRNPITPLALRVQVLRRLLQADAGPDPDARIEQSLEVIERSIAEFVRRATTLLDVSRITAGVLAPDRVPIDVVAVARAVIDDLTFAQQLLELAAPTSLTVTGDALAIEQILENLISNGIKYGQGKAVVVSIAAQQGVCMIRVSDSGDGISSKHQARIFERFERVGTDQHVGGFGVGLWLVRQLSEAMGGGVVVTSAPDSGSTFCVRLPLHSPDHHS